MHMNARSAAAVSGLAPPARLEPDAISAAQDAVIGMANAAPAVSVGLTLAALAATTAYAGGPVIVVTAVPMLVIANAYSRLNLWNANCGASSEWVGRTISPYLGFLTGWLMITGSLIGSLAGVVVLAPLYAGFYVLTGLAAIVYYRRRVLTSPLDTLTLGILPVGAAGFLVWLVGKSMSTAPAPQLWSLGAILAAGVAALLAARFGLRSSFFHIPRETDTPRH
jgi:hypothetical protein